MIAFRACFVKAGVALAVVFERGNRMKTKTTYFDEMVYYKLLEAEQEADEVSLRYSSEDVYTAMKEAIEDRQVFESRFHWQRGELFTEKDC